VHHQTATVAVRCAISFHIGCGRSLGHGTVWCTEHCLVHTGQSGVPNRPLARATRRPLIAQSTVGSGGSESPDSPVHHRTVRCTTGQSGDFKPRRFLLFPRATSSSPMYLGADAVDPPDSPVIFSHVAPPIFESGLFAAEPAWGTGQSNVPGWCWFWLS
jgi:hypothetical protein